MIAALKQKRWFEYRNFYLYEDKIVIERKAKGKFVKYEHDIEDLGFKKEYQKESPASFIAFILLCFSMPFGISVAAYYANNLQWQMVVFFTLFFACFAVVGIVNKAPFDNILLYNHNKSTLVFYRAVPNEKVVLDFIGLIEATYKQKFKKHFTEFDENTTFEHYLSSITWLKDTKVIDKAEFDVLLEDFKIKKLLE